MEYKRTKLGTLIYNVTVKAGTFVGRHRWLYYLLSYTWGIITTIIGWIMFLFSRVFLRNKIVEKGKFLTATYAILGDNWGGMGFGTNFFVAGYMPGSYTLKVACHEFGHTCQAAVWGPFVLFLFYIPSLIRYWHQEFRSRKNLDNKPYDAVYFEGSASEIGNRLYKENKIEIFTNTNLVPSLELDKKEEEK